MGIGPDAKFMLLGTAAAWCREAFHDDLHAAKFNGGKVNVYGTSQRLREFGGSPQGHFLTVLFLRKLELTMTAETARKISTNPEVLKRLAKYLAQQCFRNTMLEDLHAGITPNSQTGDYSDVFVQSPYGQIPWPRLSRLSDQEMKALMIDVVNKTYRALRVLFDDRLGSEVIKILTQQDLVPRWDEPSTD